MARLSAAPAVSARCAEAAFALYQQGQRREVLRFAMAALVLNPRHPSRRGLVSIAARALAGPRVVGWLRRAGTWRAAAPTGLEDHLRRRIAADPFDAHVHRELANSLIAQGHIVRGYACLRTAQTLARLRGADDPMISQELRAAEERLGWSLPAQRASVTARNDPYGRIRLIADQIERHMAKRRFSLLDVGGGDGFLSALLPQADYVLAEPSVNGLMGEQLPFAPRAFDVVVALHALEHVAPAQRQAFVHALIGAAKQMAVVLGPFAPPGGEPNPETGILAATGAEWACEHLTHGLPTVAALRACLDSARVRYEVSPNADERVMYWQSLACHFATMAGEEPAFVEATHFFQQHFDYAPANPAAPHDFLFIIWTAE